MCRLVCHVYKYIPVKIKTIHSSSKIAFKWPMMIIYTQEKCKKIRRPQCFNVSEKNERFSAVLKKKSNSVE